MYLNLLFEGFQSLRINQVASSIYEPSGSIACKMQPLELLVENEVVAEGFGI
jgi:hypothetical protein